MTPNPPAVVLAPVYHHCSKCNGWHPTKTCTAPVFTTDELNRKHPDKNGDGWPDWTGVW
jgi:hypothetical protein